MLGIFYIPWIHSILMLGLSLGRLGVGLELRLGFKLQVECATQFKIVPIFRMRLTLM